MCDECYRFRLDGKPACAPCAYEASTRSRRRASLTAAFLCFSVGGALWLERRFDLWAREPFWVVVAALVAVAVTIGLAISALSESQKSVEQRTPDSEPSPDEPLAGAPPYRAYARNVLLAVAPKISGQATALVVFGSLLAAAVLLPASLKLPVWIEAELVLGAWWAIVTTTLTVLLYRGFRIRDDHLYFSPWAVPRSNGERSGVADTLSSGCSGADGCGNLDGCSGLDAEGCVGALVITFAIALALGAAWVFVELAMPLVFFAFYALFMRAIGRVANDRHGCEGDWAKSVGWGSLWATVYLVPIGLLTWLLHVARR